jgi:hypothetical protein
MAATTKLIVYNNALREIASAPLADTTTANTRLYELDGAWDHAIEHVLAMHVWSFARRRATLTGIADSVSFPPYLYSFTKPSDYLRKHWFKSDATDANQVDHVEVAAAFYGMVGTGLLEYVSDDSSNYDPANWPAHFTRVLTLYLASLVAPKLARAGADDLGRLNAQMQEAMDYALQQEALFATNVQISTDREPTMRRALEFLGQTLAGTVSIHNHADKLRWHMNGSWDHAVQYVLELGAWNHASRRVLLTLNTQPIPGDTLSWIEGYSVGPASEASAADNLPAISEWDYGFQLPDDFLHKIWLKSDANHDYEAPHQFLNGNVYTRDEYAVMEYVSNDTDAVDPTRWSMSFRETVAAYLALLVSPEILAETDRKGQIKINANEIRQKLEAVFAQRLSDAKMRDAIQQYPKQPPYGRFVQARRGSIGTSGLRRGVY